MDERPPRRLRPEIGDDETVLAWARPQPRSLLGPALGLLAVGLVALTVYAVLTARGLEQAAPVATIGFVLAYSAAQSAYARIRAVFFTAYTLTDRRLLATASLVTRDTTTVPLDQVSAIEQRRGPIAALLGLDTIVVSAYGERGTSVAIPGLADADELRSRLARSTLDTASPRWLLRGD